MSAEETKKGNYLLSITFGSDFPKSNNSKDFLKSLRAVQEKTPNSLSGKICNLLLEEMTKQNEMAKEESLNKPINFPNPPIPSNFDDRYVYYKCDSCGLGPNGIHQYLWQHILNGQIAGWGCASC